MFNVYPQWQLVFTCTWWYYLQLHINIRLYSIALNTFLQIMSNEDMLFTRLYDKLALNLEAPELIQNLFSKNVITHIELKKIQEQQLPYKKTKKLLKFLRHKQNFIPIFVDAVKTIPGLQYIAEWIEKGM